MEYRVKRKQLVLPEYGRHIQQMVDYALTIEDKEERTKTAHGIVSVMGRMSPRLKEMDDFKNKLWDHLIIMSDYQLDIDNPYPAPEQEDKDVKPKNIPYETRNTQDRQYGLMTIRLIEKAKELENEEERKSLIIMIANHMKKALHMWNKDAISDEIVIQDLERLSGGALAFPENVSLHEIRNNVQNNTNNRKGKNKNKKKYR